MKMKIKISYKKTMLKQSQPSKLPHTGTSIFSQGIRSWRAELRLEMASFYMGRD